MRRSCSQSPRGPSVLWRPAHGRRSSNEARFISLPSPAQLGQFMMAKSPSRGSACASAITARTPQSSWPCRFCQVQPVSHSSGASLPVKAKRPNRFVGQCAKQRGLTLRSTRPPTAGRSPPAWASSVIVPVVPRPASPGRRVTSNVRHHWSCRAALHQSWRLAA